MISSTMIVMLCTVCFLFDVIKAVKTCDTSIWVETRISRRVSTFSKTCWAQWLPCESMSYSSPLVICCSSHLCFSPLRTHLLRRTRRRNMLERDFALYAPANGQRDSNSSYASLMDLFHMNFNEGGSGDPDTSPKMSKVWE